MTLLKKAKEYATRKHKGQLRKYSEKPYILHPVRVADRVSNHPLATDDLVAAAYLHDVIEDCGVYYSALKVLFNEQVANYVSWMTNISKPSDGNRAERKAMDRDRLAHAPKEVKILKMIDRLDNLAELDPSDGFTKKYAEESLLLAEVLKDGDEEVYREILLACTNILSS